ncbi:DUF2157 domain-containing protein [Peribacillus alkalitolerans]|uniref:DUF2157 domain-containing protein n=1 Tax=Peribacillus alkalitolerans TaxID=1550385 RepID=UPI001F0786F9|nr:DUF2157 domain-containing protein [Peribacillus alkalitolerans]
MVTRSAYEFLKREFNDLESAGHLDKGQSDRLIDLYEAPKEVPTKQSLNSIQILFLIGGILIGLGILSFVASNWSELTKMTKFIILLGTLITFYLAARRLETKHPVLSKALYYVGAFAYGAEIFYIGQLFHLGGNWEDAFLMWGIGILPLAFYLEDQKLKFVSLAFIYIYIHNKFIWTDDLTAYVMLVIFPIMFAFGHFVMKRSLPLFWVNILSVYIFIQAQFAIKPIEVEGFPYVFLLLLPVLFYIGHKYLDRSKPLFVINLIMTLQFFVMAFNYFNIEKFLIVLLFYFIIGMTFVYIQHQDYKVEIKAIGMVLHFVTAVTLSFPYWWEDVSAENAWMLSLGFSILYLIYALSLVRRENLFGVTIVCVFIFRFYVDLSLAFMNKSIAFLIGGILLLALGYWFEKTRRKEMTKNEETIKE